MLLVLQPRKPYTVIVTENMECPFLILYFKFLFLSFLNLFLDFFLIVVVQVLAFLFHFLFRDESKALKSFSLNFILTSLWDSFTISGFLWCRL